MLLKIKQKIFLNELIIEVQEPEEISFKALLKDEKGTVCKSLEMEAVSHQSFYKWNGLNELPYGVYTCEIFSGSEELKTELIKRL